MSWDEILFLTQKTATWHHLKAGCHIQVLVKLHDVYFYHDNVKVLVKSQKNQYSLKAVNQNIVWLLFSLRTVCSHIENLIWYLAHYKSLVYAKH